MLTLFVVSSLNVRGKAKESGHIENSQSHWPKAHHVTCK